MEKINFCRTLFEETRFMSLLIKSTLSSIVARHGLNPYQAHLLGEIASQDGQTIKELAYHLCVKPSNFKPIAQPLEERGLIERDTHGDDRRRSVLALSGEGLAVHAQVAPLALDIEQRLLAGLDAEERGQLQRLLDKLGDGIGRLESSGG